MSSPKISVIIPVYNTERYLRRCVDSVLTQTFTDFEVLLIDDGSKDKSGEICDEYVEKDSRIKVFHKENGGVSSARNVGLDNACGEWVVFVDADDKVADGYFTIRKDFEDSDVIQKPHIIVTENQNLIYNYQELSVLRERDSIFRYYVQKRNNALWDKLIKRNLIKDTRFNTNVFIGEDFLFFLSILPGVRKWAFDNVGAYHYYIHNGSAMQSVEHNTRIGILWENMQHVQGLTASLNLQFLQKSIIYKSYVMLLYNYWHKLNNDEQKQLKELFYKMKMRDLKYIDTATKIKLLIYKVKFAIWL